MSVTEAADRSIMDQILLLGYLAGLKRRVFALYNEYEDKLEGLLRRRYSRNITTNSERYRELSKEFLRQRKELNKKLGELLAVESEELIDVERQRAWLLLLSTLDGLTGDAPKVTASKIMKQPFASGDEQVATYADWLKGLLAADFKRLWDGLNYSVVHNETKSEAVSRLLGSEEDAEVETPGLAHRSKVNVAAFLTTLVTHLSRSARRAVYEATIGVTGEIWISVLDSVTSVICRVRDHKVHMFPGNRAPVGAALLSPPTARPPAHVGCRSVMAPLFGPILPVRQTYKEWLTNQPNQIQDRILGEGKAKLFREGKVPLEDFVDSSGHEYTLKELLAQ